MSQISSKQFRILAIAPSTSGFGFVVMEGDKTIIECATRVARVKDGDKNAQSIAKVEKLLNFYQPGVLVLPDVEAKGSRRALRIKSLNHQIRVLAKKHKVQAALISGEKMRKLLLADSKATRHEMAKKLARDFPNELSSRLPPKRKLWKSEDTRMDIFYAVALAVVFRMR